MNFPIKMAPNHHHFLLNALPMEPVSRTYQYRKIMKPMLERKRRARINKCLDELKDLMTGTLQADGENVSKLEKADILELTVRHLHRLRENNALFLRNNEKINTEKFWAGFHHCAAEVSQFLNKYDRHMNNDLIKHITSYIPNMTATAAAAAAVTALSTTTTTTTAALPKTTATNTANYQRFSTAINQFASTIHTTTTEASVTSSSVTASSATMKQTHHFYGRNATTAPTRTAIATAAKLKMHPYARAVEVGGGGGHDVWRPW